MNCKRCGAEFERKVNSQKYCKACLALGKDVLSGKVFDYTKPQHCDYCNKEFYSNRKRRYCEACAAKAYLKNTNEKRKFGLYKPIEPKTYSKTCIQCGKKFTTKVKATQHCSISCASRTAATKMTQIEKKCVQCGKAYLSNANCQHQKCCSKKCRDAYYRINNPIKAQMKRQKYFAKKHDATVTDVNPQEIFRRDGWVCQLCGHKVNPKLKYPHPMSASLDHIIPLSKGGTHEPKNCQLAHLRCNVSKGNRGNDQLRLFG